MISREGLKKKSEWRAPVVRATGWPASRVRACRSAFDL